MGTEKRRKQIIRDILHAILVCAELNKDVERKKLEAQICIEHGVTRSKAWEYIQLLIDAQKLVEVEGILKLRDYEAEAKISNPEPVGITNLGIN